MDRISHLPEPVLHRILYFLRQNEAARTCVLSKAWRYTWSTRSTVEFRYKSLKGTKYEFVTLVNKILQAYHDQNLCIDEFVLETPTGEYATELLNKWIPVVMRKGEITKFHLFTFTISNREPKLYGLPPEVFNAQSVQDISPTHCNLNRIKAPNHNPNLRKLCLSFLLVKNETFQEIISSCPLIEDIQIASCAGFKSLKVSNLRNLRSFSISNYCRNADQDIEIEETPNLETLLIQYDNWVLDPNHSFCNLKNLTLRGVTLSSNSFDCFSCNLLSLEKLIVFRCHGFKKFHLRSPTLKHFEFTTSIWMSFEIDAPNMLYFQYWGLSIPSLAFTTISNECKSNISIKLSPLDLLNASLWFSRLKEMLDVLRKSEIFLDICLLKEKCEWIEKALISISEQNVEVPQLVVECLHFTSHSPMCSPLLTAFFGIFRPMKIEHSWCFFSANAKSVVEFLWKSLMERGDIQNEKLIKQQSSWQHDLEEVSVETFHESRDNWLPFQGKNWLECAMPSTQKQAIRFRLKWKEAGFN